MAELCLTLINSAPKTFSIDLGNQFSTGQAPNFNPLKTGDEKSNQTDEQYDEIHSTIRVNWIRYAKVT
jgi:hypothetical protein